MNGDPTKGYQILSDLKIKPKRPKPPLLVGFERWKLRVTNPATGQFLQNPEKKDVTYPYHVIHGITRVLDLRTKNEYLTTEKDIVGCDAELNEVAFPQSSWEMYEQVIVTNHKTRNPMTGIMESRPAIQETYMEFTVPFTTDAVEEAIKLENKIRGAKFYVREEGRSLDAFVVNDKEDFLNKTFKQLFYEPHQKFFQMRGMIAQNRANK